jgi:hypothetical protein
MRNAPFPSSQEVPSCCSEAMRLTSVFPDRSLVAHGGMVSPSLA